MPAKKVKEFNLDNYLAKVEPETVEIELPDGVKFDIQVLELGWKRRNFHVVSATIRDSTVEGGGRFDADIFASGCLKDMIVEAPWGKTTETFLSKINADLGDALSVIVPWPTDLEEDMELAKEAKK